MNDSEIRNVLLLDLGKSHGNDTKIVNELGICQGVARIDIAMINGSLSGFEIKSEKDTLSRLPRQISFYNKVFDFITIVTTDTHLAGVRQLIPHWWGISVAAKENEVIKITTLKECDLNENVDIFSLSQLLWRDEALELLSHHGIDRGLRNKPRAILWKQISASFPYEEVSRFVRHRLKTREARISDRQ
ncbi:MAG: sce7726 family protein [Ignavibacteriota bacterium]